MNVFFLVCAVFGSAAAAGLAVMLIGFRVRVNLGFILPKGRTVPLEHFVPQSVYGYTVFLASFGYAGLLLCRTALPVYFAVPICIMSAMLVNFAGAHFLRPLFTAVFSGMRPKASELEGKEAVAAVSILGDGYGTVRVKHNGQSYFFDCISVYHTDIAKGESVVIVTGEGDLLFVQKQDEIYNVFKEEGQ